MIQSIEFLKDVTDIIRYHHSRYDGKGYPNGLKGSEIPLGARLIAVADAYDTMTTDRSYHQAMSVDQGIHEVEDCAGTQFCPAAVNAFIHGIRTGFNGERTAVDI